MDFLIRAKTLVFPLLFVLLVAVVMFFNGNEDAAWIVAYLGTVIIMFGNIIFMVVHHSRKRWPDTTWLVRLGRIFFFQR